MRVPMNPYSRSPWADWFRFMKSMSMLSQGMSRLNWVCRCRSGLRSSESPAIHIFAGEKVCIQVIRPAHPSSAFASRHSVRIASGVVRTGLNTTRTGISDAPSRPAVICRECSATCSKVSGP